MPAKTIFAGVVFFHEKKNIFSIQRQKLANPELG